MRGSDAGGMMHIILAAISPATTSKAASIRPTGEGFSTGCLQAIYQTFPPELAQPTSWCMYYNVAVKTGFGQRLSKTQTLKKVGHFYDLASPYYLRVWGEHIHDGYYTTGKESKRQAQVKLVQLLASEAKISEGDTVLDVGCGMGGSSIWLANHLGATTVGITISSKQAKIAVERAGQQEAESSFILMDAEQMAIRPEVPIFDAIWAVAVMTHLRDQQSFMNAASRMLKKGGRFIIFDWMLGPDADGGRDPS